MRELEHPCVLRSSIRRHHTTMKIFGIDYAPLLIPLERRRQTWAVFVWIGSFFFMGPAGVIALLYMFFYTRFYFVPLLYLAWYIADSKTPESGGRR